MFIKGEKLMSDVRLKLSPPWVIYVHKLEALFDGDPHIAFNVDWDAPSVVISVAKTDGVKAAAIARLLPAEKQFGNVSLAITVECQSMANQAFTSAKQLYEAAFQGNPCFAYAVVPESVYWAVPFTYVVFKNCVVQFFADNLNDPHGLISTLYQDIAAEVFADVEITGAGVSYCTDIEAGKLGMPLGEWP
jgi:hypothetical protein